MKPRSPREPPAHPLAGVLDRLLQRERGAGAARVTGGQRTSQEPTAPAERRTAATSRKMLAVAALGADGGRVALRSIASWAVEQGRRPVVIDLCGEDPGEADGPAAEGVPRASIPGGVESLRARPAEARAAVVQLRRYESAGDLLIVRIPPGQRMALMQAAFLTGGLVLPIDASDETLDEAWNVLREVSEYFDGVVVWPYPCAREGLDRFRDMARDSLAVELQPLDVVDPESVTILGRLAAPPEEGFLAALLEPAGSSRGGLVRLDDLSL